MSVKSSRKRAKNYTTEDEVLLVDLVDAYKNILENKKSDAVIWRQKEETWRKIEEEFSATSGTYRHWKTLRDKYEVIKRKSKTEIATRKSETYRTGGGVSSTKVGTVSAKIAAMLGDAATGLINVHDSDCVLDDDDGDGYKLLETSIEKVEEEKLASNEDFGKEIVSIEEKTDWSNWTPTNLKQTKSKELVVGAKRKRTLECERIELTILQQKFYRDENTRAQEKHEQELLSLQLKNEILQVELAAKNQNILYEQTL